MKSVKNYEKNNGYYEKNIGYVKYLSALFVPVVFALCLSFLWCIIGPVSRVSAKDFHLKLKVVSTDRVKLSWNAVKGAKEYRIIRLERTGKDITPGPIKKKTRLVLARVSATKRSYLDATAKKGSYYQYRIEAVLEKGIKKTGNIAQTVVQNAYWKEGMVNAVSPEKIKLAIGFNQNPWTRLAPSGLDIYRGTSYWSMKKYRTVKLHRRGKGNAYPTLHYEDRNVTPGQSYYYKARPFTKLQGKKVYGPGTVFLQQSAILPAGAYSAEVTLPASGEALTVTLTGQSDGNAELDFMENQFYGLLEMLCQKKDGSYDAISLRLHSCRIGDGEWLSFDGQDIRMAGKQSLTFQLVPYLPGESIPSSVDDYLTAELLLRLRYEDDERDLHINAKDGLAFLTNAGKTSGVTYHGDQFSLWQPKQRKKAKRVAEAYLIGSYGSTYADYDTGIRASYVDDYETSDLSKRMIPDGVRLYRSEDNLHFTPVAELAYPRGFDYVTYQDPTIQPGRTYYYKAKNYVDTKKGRKYSAAMKYSLTFQARYGDDRYSILLPELQEKSMVGKELTSPVVFRIQGLSFGNPKLVLDSSAWAEAILWEEGADWGDVIEEKLTAYSLDGVNWEKLPQKGLRLELEPKQVVYLSMVAKVGQGLTELKPVKSLEIDLSLEDGTGTQCFQYDLVKDQTSAYVSSNQDVD